jgi:hypothetical protein
LSGAIAVLFLLFLVIGIHFGVKSKASAPPPIVAPRPVVTPTPTPTPTPVANVINDKVGCLDGQTATVVAIVTEKTTATDGYMWDNAVSFETPDGLTVTCTFNGDGIKLDDLWKPGMRIRTAHGERIIGSFGPREPTPDADKL